MTNLYSTKPAQWIVEFVFHPSQHNILWIIWNNWWEYEGWQIYQNDEKCERFSEIENLILKGYERGSKGI